MALRGPKLGLIYRLFLGRPCLRYAERSVCHKSLPYSATRQCLQGGQLLSDSNYQPYRQNAAGGPIQ